MDRNCYSLWHSVCGGRIFLYCGYILWNYLNEWNGKRNKKAYAFGKVFSVFVRSHTNRKDTYPGIIYMKLRSLGSSVKDVVQFYVDVVANTIFILYSFKTLCTIFSKNWVRIMFWP